MQVENQPAECANYAKKERERHPVQLRLGSGVQ